MPNSKVSVWTTDNATDADQEEYALDESSEEVLWTPFLIGLALGIIVGGIGLSTILVLFIQGIFFNRFSFQ